MCEHSGRLIAWLDGELPPGDAVALERHLCICTSCQGELCKYERLSDALNGYCDVVLACGGSRQARGTKTVLQVAGAVAALAAILFVTTPVREMQHAGGLASQPPAAPAAPIAAGAAITTVERASQLLSGARPAIVRKARPARAARNAAEPGTNQEAGWMMAEPAIQITIPADAVLPPGAAPAGASFVADVRIAGDGSAGEVLVRP